MAAKKKADDGPAPGKVRYLVERSGDESDVLIEVQNDWKITFGYVNPARTAGTDDFGNNRRGGHCLRIYSGKTAASPLRMVLGNVISIRDMTIPFAIEVTKEVGERKWSASSEGDFEQHSTRQIERTFEANGHQQDMDTTFP